uniref:Ras-related protein Rap-2a n=1 Tax=Halisarca dujardinii TaxID=2583056 RepID=A0AA96S0F7_HALDU|nr:ras-related protein Rap-2a [Halisarca dujardinii]
MGTGGVGKSALTLRIISGTFTPNYTPTIEDYYRHETNVPSIGPCIVEPDSGQRGTEQFSSMRQLYISSSQAFAIVYAVDDRDSFEEAKGIYKEIVQSKPEGQARVILVGNKSDLYDAHRRVPIAEALQLCKTMANAPFLETSAKDNINVHELFTKLVHLARDNVESSSKTLKPRRRTFNNGFTNAIRKSFRMSRQRRRVNSAHFSDGAGAHGNSQRPSARRRQSRCAVM